VNWIRSTVPESRSFLIKHGQDSVVARLNLRAMPDLIKVLSGRTETVAELDALRARVGDDPAAWLPIFLGRAKP
jgi:type IV secretion system protein VirB4